MCIEKKKITKMGREGEGKHKLQNVCLVFLCEHAEDFSYVYLVHHKLESVSDSADQEILASCLCHFCVYFLLFCS